MRTTTGNRWVWVFAGALPALGACGDDTTAPTTTSAGAGGFGGFGGGDATQASSSTSSASGNPTSSSSGGNPTSSSSSGGDGGSGAGGDPGQGGGGSGQGGSAAECGNGLLEEGEACDGVELGDASCESEGFFAGDIACTDDCELDVSACTNCGNDTVDDGEECDGTDLDGTECTDLEDFVSGDLACTDQCTFDTLACVGAECGDGEINGSDECEEGMLDGETCASQGFVDGTLECTNCQFDTAACNSCGDDTVNGDDVCDGDDLGGATCADAGNFTGGTLACAAGCGAFDTSGCTNFPVPAVGEIVITEIMVDPDGNPPIPNANNFAEWFEVTNPSVGTTYQLGGCTITSNNDGTFTIPGDLAIGPGEIVTFAKSSPGFTADVTYPDGFAFANGGDTVVIACGGVDVDVVDYNAASFDNVANGRSLSLDPASVDAGDNDDGANWCDASTVGAGFTTGDFGTPGEANPSCGAGNFTVDFCELQSPLTINATEGTSVTVFGQVRIDGLTNLTVGNDLNPLVIASVGFGDDGTDPATDASWQFIAATPNAGYNDSSPGYTVNQDEYQATFNVPAAAGSPYDYAFRFSGDGGDTWTYCDSTGGAYTPADAGQMTSTPSLVDYELFFSRYIERSTGNEKALQIHNRGGAVDLGACVVNLYTNGNTTVTNTVTLPNVTLPAQGEFVICNPSSTTLFLTTDPTPGPCDIDSNVTNFNGDDAIELVCASNPIDIIGEIGFDPGTAWGTNPDDTDEVILTRVCVAQGDTVGSDDFDPGPEWDGTTWTAGDAITALGSYPNCP